MLTYAYALRLIAHKQFEPARQALQTFLIHNSDDSGHARHAIANSAINRAQGFEMSNEEIFALLDEAIACGVADAAIDRGWLAIRGVGGPKDFAMALHYFTQAKA